MIKHLVLIYLKETDRGTKKRGKGDGKQCIEEEGEEGLLD